MDLLGLLLKNEYTEEIYNFPEQDYGTVYTTLSVHWKPEIIQAHNENINVISTEGVGTEFIFTLPLSKKEG